MTILEISFLHALDRVASPLVSGLAVIPTARAPCGSRVSRLTAGQGGHHHLQQSLKVWNISVIYSKQTLPATVECTCFPVCPQLTGSCGELLLASRARELEFRSPSKDQNPKLEIQFLPGLHQVKLSSVRPP